MNPVAPRGVTVRRLTEGERRTVARLAEALFPRVVPARTRLDEIDSREVGLPGALAEAVERRLTDGQFAEFRRFLSAIENPLWNLVLSGRPVRFGRLDPAEREAFLAAWATSGLEVKRRGFQAVKRLALFLAYAAPPGPERSPAWAAVGYPGPPKRAPTLDAEVLPALRPWEPGPVPEVETDCVVVGSGAGGSVIASELARRGWRVIVLEAGPWRTAGTFSGSEGESVASLFARGGLLTTRDLAFVVLAGRAVGGSTSVNWMTCLRPLPTVRREWAIDHGLEGLDGPPFDRHLDAIEQRLGVTTRESTLNGPNAVLRRGAERLGYREGADFSVISRNAAGCASRCDFCTYGCPYEAKQSALVTFLADAQRAGAHLLPAARAERVLLRGERAVGVEVRRGAGENGPILRIRAREVVLAAGAVETPALLQRSGIRSPGVGRGLRLHPTAALVGEFPESVRPWAGPMQTVVVNRAQRKDPSAHGAWLESVPVHPGLAALSVPWRDGAQHKAAMARLERTAATIALVRDIGEGRVAVDGHGEAVLDYRLARADEQNLVEGLVEVARIHAAAGAVRISSLHAEPVEVGDGTSPIAAGDLEAFVERLRRRGLRRNDAPLFSAHPTGSARAGADPRRSTARPDGAVHGVDGLWIGDGSLFPTAPGVNPMVGIMALARRTAGFVSARLGGAPPGASQGL